MGQQRAAYAAPTQDAARDQETEYPAMIAFLSLVVVVAVFIVDVFIVFVFLVAPRANQVRKQKTTQAAAAQEPTRN